VMSKSMPSTIEDDTLDTKLLTKPRVTIGKFALFDEVRIPAEVALPDQRNRLRTTKGITPTQPARNQHSETNSINPAVPVESSQQSHPSSASRCADHHHQQSARQEENPIGLKPASSLPESQPDCWPRLSKPGPHHLVTGTDHFLSAIQAAMAWTPSSAFHPPEFEFKLSYQSALHNARILEDSDFDVLKIWQRLDSNHRYTDELAETTRAQTCSITRPGSEF
jgi:hypothetical protein